MKTRILTLLLLTTLLYSQTWEQEKYDAIHYQIEFDFNFETHTSLGELTMQAVIIDDSIQEMQLDFLSDIEFHTISRVLINGNQRDYVHLSNRITIPFIDVPALGDTVEVKVSWETDQYPDSAGWNYVWEFNWTSYAGQDLIFSASRPDWGAHYWWPCKDHHSDKPDSMDIYLTVPSDYYAVSNGSLRSTIDNGDATQTFYWHESYPIAPYLFSVNVYPFFIWSDEYVSVSNDTMPIMFYTLEDTLAGSELVINYSKTKDMISTFAELFCEYPFINEKYGHAQVLGSRSKAHQSISNLADYSESRIVHELAHQWWGVMISPESFHNLWLSEGFATYSEALWDESNYGSDAYFNHFTDEGILSEESIYLINPGTAGFGTVFDPWLRHQKPSFVLHMLRRVVGDETFFEILQTYADDPAFKYSSATTEDFRGVCEDLSGIDLEQFFDQWIYGLNHPVYNYDWRTIADDTGYSVELIVNQVQENLGLFRMPIDIEISNEFGTTMHTIQDSMENQFFDLSEMEDPIQLGFDPNNWVLKELERVQFFTPHGTNVQVNSLYQRPNQDTLVFTAQVINPDSLPTSLSATIEAEEQILAPNAQLFDDGTGFDELASDGIFTGYWPVPPGELMYNIDLKATAIDSGFSVISDDLAVFTTVGPLVFGGFEAGTDTSMEPGGNISFRIAITNPSETFDANYITAQITSLDTSFSVQSIGNIIFGAIDAGQTADMTSGLFRISHTEEFEGSFSVPLALEISELGQLFWQDTFMFSIDVVGIDELLNRPDEYALHQNYPNPFNPSTTIKYGLPQSAEISLTVYNLMGQEIISLIDETQEAGWYEHNWNGIDEKGQTVATGLYLARLESAGFSQTIKMVYLR